jgi:SAM-dependent methyltransferase
MTALRTRLVAANDSIWDGVLGVDTSGADCQPTAYHVLRRILRAVPMDQDDSIVDFGCGRGRVLCLAALNPIASARGVEIRSQHAEAAQSNLANLRGRKARQFEVTSGSAADFDCSGGTVFYMYNPFGGALFEQVIGNIRVCARTAKRPVRLVYLNPTCRSLLDGADWLQTPQVLHRDRAGKDAVLLYTSR